MYQTSIEVSRFENTYFVNKLYIVKYVFLHRHFSYMLNFWYNKKIHYLFSRKDEKSWRTFEVVHCQDDIMQYAYM